MSFLRNVRFKCWNLEALLSRAKGYDGLVQTNRRLEVFPLFALATRRIELSARSLVLFLRLASLLVYNMRG